MERLRGLAGNADALVPQASSQVTQQSDAVASDGLFVVDVQGQTPAFKQRPPPAIRSPSPAGSASSDEEVVFAGRRHQPTRVAASARSQK